MKPNGDGPRNDPAIRHLNLPALGQPGRASPLLTKTLLFIGEGDPINVRTPPGGGGRKFRAFDKATGSVVWETEFSAGVTGAPMTYMHNGKQYIVVAIGSADHPAEFVALALP
jgi:quinoprotein glucose dehydrogenase